MSDFDCSASQVLAPLVRALLLYRVSVVTTADSERLSKICKLNLEVLGPGSSNSEPSGHKRPAALCNWLCSYMDKAHNHYMLA